LQAQLPLSAAQVVGRNSWLRRCRDRAGAQCPHHVKYNACLALLVEAQIMPHCEIEYSIPMSSGNYGQSTEITVPVPG
jgi:hypothetical protein